MLKIYGMLLFACAMWGFQPVCIKWLVAEWSPVTVTVIRYIFICLLWLVAAYKMDGSAMIPREGKDWLCLMGMGLFGILLNNVVQFTGIKYTTITNCTLIAAMTPAVTGFMAFFILRQKLSALKWLGIFIYFVGVFTVVTHGDMNVVRHITFNKGDLYCLVAQASWATYSFFSLRVMKDITPEAATLWFSLFGGAFTGLYGMAAGEIAVTPLSPLAMGAFVFIVLIGGFLSLFFYNVGVKKAGPSVAAIFLNIMPIVGMLSGYFLFHDPIGPVQLGGAAAILAGVYMTTHVS